MQTTDITPFYFKVKVLDNQYAALSLLTIFMVNTNQENADRNITFKEYLDFDDYSEQVNIYKNNKHIGTIYCSSLGDKYTEKEGTQIIALSYNGFSNAKAFKAYIDYLKDRYAESTEEQINKDFVVTFGGLNEDYIEEYIITSTTDGKIKAKLFFA